MKRQAIMLRNRQGLMRKLAVGVAVMLSLSSVTMVTLLAQEAALPTEVPTAVSPEAAARVPEEQQFTLPITEDVTYMIQPRDTLDGIGAAFDVSIACMREVNNLRPADLIQPKQPLIISVSCPPYDGVLAVAAIRENAPGRVIVDGTYTVRVNDTLDSIGRQFDVSVEALLVANDIRYGRLLRIGQVIAIPEDAPAYGVFPALPLDEEAEEALGGRFAAAGDDAEQYVVQPGDTLDTIGQQLDISVVELLQVNGVKRGRDLRAGQVLVIPADHAPYGEYPVLLTDENQAILERLDSGEIEGETYTVQPNDTLDTIGQALNVSVVALRVTNDITSARDLLPGQVLVIPADAPEYGAYPALDQPAGGGGGGTRAVTSGASYVIQPGDTLDGIAARHNVDTLCLITANDIKVARLIQPGQTVAIPSDCAAYSGYDVVAAPATMPAPTSTPEVTEAEASADGDES